MTETKIWKLAVPEVSLEDVFQAEGADYSKRRPQPSTEELHRRIIAEAASLVKPTAIWREVEITGTGVQELYLEDGYKLTSKLLAKLAGTAEKLLLFAMTIGSVFEDRLTIYKGDGKISEAFALDAAGTAFITKASMAALTRLDEIYRKEGLYTTFPLGPGHSYWSRIEDLRIILHFLKAEQIGLTLTDSNLIMPRKSVTMVMGVGQNLPDSHDQTHCNFCSLRATSQLSQAGQKNLDN